MSITITTREQALEQYTCDRGECDHRFTEPEAVAGSYCSTECRDRARGEGALVRIRRDHRFCGSCYRPRKTVYRPDDADVPDLRRKALIIRESFVGFEDLSEFAALGPHGVECACGTTDHTTEEQLFRDGEPWHWWLSAAIQQLREEGFWEYECDAATLADAFWREQDLALAVGKALNTR